MDTVTGIVALLRKQSELELQILYGHGVAAATVRDFEATWRRLAARPQALSAVLQTTPAAADARSCFGTGRGGLGLLELGRRRRALPGQINRSTEWPVSGTATVANPPEPVTAGTASARMFYVDNERRACSVMEVRFFPL